MVQPTDSPSWIPFEEPLRATVLRTSTIALVLGTIIFATSKHRITWLVAVLVALWPAFGGHWIELWFLNWLRPRISPQRQIQVLARLTVWLLGGTMLAVMMRYTVRVLGGVDIGWRIAWLGGVAFIAIELLAHAALAGRRQGNFYDGQG